MKYKKRILMIMFLLVIQVHTARRTKSLLSFGKSDKMKVSNITLKTALVIVLIMIIMMYVYEDMPPMTVLIIVICLALHTKIGKVKKLNMSRVCMSTVKVTKNRHYMRLFTSPFFHGNDQHFMYCMISFLIKASILEDYFGSDIFLVLFGFSVVMSNLISIPVSFILEIVFKDPSYLTRCSVGLNGVAFAMQGIIGIMLGRRSIANWLELPLVSMVMPKMTALFNVTGYTSGIIIMIFIDKVSAFHQMRRGCRGNRRDIGGHQPRIIYPSVWGNGVNGSPGIPAGVGQAASGCWCGRAKCRGCPPAQLHPGYPGTPPQDDGGVLVQPCPPYTMSRSRSGWPGWSKGAGMFRDYGDAADCTN